MKKIFRMIGLKFYKPILKANLHEPIFYQLKSLPEGRFFRLIRGSILRLIPTYTSGSYERIVDERIVEVPFALQNIGLNKNSKILDFGCNESKLSIELASLGFDVTGVDLNDYEFSHPNFKFIKGDLLDIKFQDEIFDMVIAVSTIEHCGLGSYGESQFSDGDRKVVNEIYRILKKRGRFVITVPFGKKGKTSLHRIYDEDSLNRLLEKFKIKRQDFFIGIDRRNWFPVKKEELSKVDSVSKGFVQSVACTMAEKVEGQ